MLELSEMRKTVNLQNMQKGKKPTSQTESSLRCLLKEGYFETVNLLNVQKENLTVGKNTELKYVVSNFPKVLKKARRVATK